MLPLCKAMHGPRFISLLLLKLRVYKVSFRMQYRFKLNYHLASLSSLLHGAGAALLEKAAQAAQAFTREAKKAVEVESKFEALREMRSLPEEGALAESLLATPDRCKIHTPLRGNWI